LQLGEVEHVHIAICIEVEAVAAGIESTTWAEKARGIWPELYELVGGGEEWVNMTLRYKETGAF